jgi:hypothetical protein
LNYGDDEDEFTGLQTPGRPTRSLQDSDRLVLDGGMVVVHALIIRTSEARFAEDETR